jgi:hypothetical protein
VSASFPIIMNYLPRICFKTELLITASVLNVDSGIEILRSA